MLYPLSYEGLATSRLPGSGVALSVEPRPERSLDTQAGATTSRGRPHRLRWVAYQRARGADRRACRRCHDPSQHHRVPK